MYRRVNTHIGACPLFLFFFIYFSYIDIYKLNKLLLRRRNVCLSSNNLDVCTFLPSSDKTRPAPFAWHTGRKTWGRWGLAQTATMLVPERCGLTPPSKSIISFSCLTASSGKTLPPTCQRCMGACDDRLEWQLEKKNKMRAQRRRNQLGWFCTALETRRSQHASELFACIFDPVRQVNTGFFINKQWTRWRTVEIQIKLQHWPSKELRAILLKTK